MEQSFEVRVSALYVLQSFCEVLDCRGEVHEAGVDQSAVEVVEPVGWFHGDGFVKFSQGIVDLVEHHHTVASVGVVLGVVAVEPDGSAKVVHGFLVVSDGHEGFSSFRVVLGVSGAFVVVGG